MIPPKSAPGRQRRQNAQKPVKIFVKIDEEKMRKKT